MDQSPLDALTANLYQFTKKERAIAEFILNDPQFAFQCDAETVAQKTGTSKAAFIRLCQKIGFNGYAEFRFALSRAMFSNPPEAVATDDPILRITYTYARFIEQIAHSVSLDDLKTVATKILISRRIKVFGYNRTYLSAQQLRMRMGKMGLDAESVGDTISMMDIVDILTPDDVIVLFSIKVVDQFYGNIIREAHSRGCPIILITMTPNNKFTDLVTHQVVMPYISKSTTKTFLDDQAIFFVFIELLLNELARQVNQQ